MSNFYFHMDRQLIFITHHLLLYSMVPFSNLFLTYLSILNLIIIQLHLILLINNANLHQTIFYYYTQFTGFRSVLFVNSKYFNTVHTNNILSFLCHFVRCSSLVRLNFILISTLKTLRNSNSRYFCMVESFFHLFSELFLFVSI